MGVSKAIWASAIISALSTSALAQQTLTGTVATVDEKKGTITIHQGGTSSGAAQEFKAQDGLLLNALQPGDKVSFTVSDVNGTKTISQLNKQ